MGKSLLHMKFIILKDYDSLLPNSAFLFILKLLLFLIFTWGYVVDFFFFRERESGGGRETEIPVKETLIHCFLHALNGTWRWKEAQPHYVHRLGVKPKTLWCRMGMMRQPTELPGQGQTVHF